MRDLFSFAEAQRRRDTGMALASLAQDDKQPEWSDLAYAAIVSIARRQATVHVDDVLRTFTDRPEHPNAWGLIWQRAIKANVIERTGQVKPCTVDSRKHAHQYPLY